MFLIWRYLVDITFQMLSNNPNVIDQEQEDLRFPGIRMQQHSNNQLKKIFKKRASLMFWFLVLAIIFVYALMLDSYLRIIEKNESKINLNQPTTELLSITGQSYQEEKKNFLRTISVENKIQKHLGEDKKIQTQINNLSIRLNNLENSNAQRNGVNNLDKRSQSAGVLPVLQGTVNLVQFFKKNSQGKSIEDILYPSQQERDKRIKYHEERIEFISKQAERYPFLTFANYNMKINGILQIKEAETEAAEYKRLNDKFRLGEVKNELPMCLVVPGYNNNAKSRIEYNLNSIFTQNYTNYFAVLIDDASSDGTAAVIQKYLNFYGINKQRYVLLENKKRLTALENIYIATTNYCSQDSIVINIDGDDEFLGRNVLKVFNAVYQQKKSGVLYSNFYWYQQPKNVIPGFTSEYADQQKDNNRYRDVGQKFSHLRSYRTELFLQIDPKDFKDEGGNFYTSAYDMVIYFPLMQLSCSQVHRIDQFHYLYNMATGLNDYQVDRNKQATIDNKVRRSPNRYKCSKKFEAKIKE